MNDSFCFVHAAIITIYHKEIGDHPERISNKLLKYAQKLDWIGIDFPVFISDYKIFGKNNKDMPLNILYVPYEEEEIIDKLPEYISQFIFTRNKQVALLKISNAERWHILDLKSEQGENSDCMKTTESFSKLMRDISSDSHENYYCFGCFHSFRCNSTSEKHTRLCKDHDFCRINLPKNNKNIREHKNGSKSLSDLGNIGTELFDPEKMSMTLLTPEQNKQHSESDKCLICQKKFNNNKKVSIIKNLEKLQITIITQVYTEEQHILYVI